MGSEMGDFWNSYKKERQEKRATNRSQSLALLRREGIEPQVNDSGSHLIIRLDDGRRFDFWPGTGKWVEDLDHDNQKRGVRELLRRIQAASSSG